MIVEDNEADASQIAKLLAGDIITVSVADSGEKAMQELNEKEFDCIILDYSMPDIPGPQLVEKVAGIKIN